MIFGAVGLVDVQVYFVRGTHFQFGHPYQIEYRRLQQVSGLGSLVRIELQHVLYQVDSSEIALAKLSMERARLVVSNHLAHLPHLSLAFLPDYERLVHVGTENPQYLHELVLLAYLRLLLLTEIPIVVAQR